MRSMVMRQRLVRSAAVAVSVALVAACGTQPDGRTPDATPSASTPAKPAYASGTGLISTGTETVTVGGVAVTFPTKVSEAAWSPDGSRITFIDGDGNVNTARPDGTGRLVLTKSADGVTRSHPTWVGAEVVYTEKGKNGKTRLMSVFANGIDTDYHRGAVEFTRGMDAPEQGNSYPSGAAEGPGREFAYQHQGAKGPEVWVTDLNSRQPWSEKVADGSQPAIAPDGLKVAFVAPNGQVKVASTDFPRNKLPKPVQVTFGVQSPSHLAWSPDGTHVAFQTAADVQSVAIGVPAGATANEPTQVSPTSGVVTYLGAPRDRVVRLSGSDPVDVAIAGSRARWSNQPEYGPNESGRHASGAVIVGTKDLEAAIVGSQVWNFGPLLFTGADTLDRRTAEELKRALGRTTSDYGPEILILGDTTAVSAQVETTLRDLGYKPVRISAKDRYTLAAAVANRANPRYADAVFVVSGDNPSGIAMAAATGGYDRAVLLADGSSLPAGARTYLNKLDKAATVFALDENSRAALAASWSGKPANLKVKTLFDPFPLADGVGATNEAVVVANKSSIVDMMVGVATAHYFGGVLVVADDKGLPDPAKAWLDKSSAAVDAVYIVDSGGAVKNDVETVLGGLVSGPLGFTAGANPTAS